MIRQEEHVTILGMPMADWWASLEKVLKLLAYVPGWYALWRTFRADRTILTFTIEPSETRDEPGGESTFKVDVTVTNRGTRPVTIQEVRCAFTCTAERGETGGIGRCVLDNKRIGLEEALSVSVVLPVTPWHSIPNGYSKTSITSVTEVCVLDSTGKKWSPSRKAMRTFYCAADNIWNLRKPEGLGARYRRILRRSSQPHGK